MIDYHVHSEFSDDSEYEMEALIQDAMKKGIKEICLTDHVDYGIKRDWDDPRGMLYRPGGPGEPEQMPIANVDYPRYADKIDLLRRKYEDEIKIRFGLEFGMQRHTIAQYERLFKSYSFDFIILSIHEIEDKEFWTGEFQEKYSRDEYIRKYYEELLYLVTNYHNYSVLGHMDLITRYDAYEDPYPFEKIRPLVTEILKTVIADGKGIEVNTSCYRYGLKDLTPSREILKLYLELGGEILTIGSDSHKKEHLGAHIEETLQELKKIGFKNVYIFDQMKAISRKI